jgi:hypothetical protein
VLRQQKKARTHGCPDQWHHQHINLPSFAEPYFRAYKPNAFSVATEFKVIQQQLVTRHHPKGMLSEYTNPNPNPNPSWMLSEYTNPNPNPNPSWMLSEYTNPNPNPNPSWLLSECMHGKASTLAT